MKPSTIARIALVILALGLLATVAALGGLNTILGILAVIFVWLGLSGLIVAAIGVYDE